MKFSWKWLNELVDIHHIPIKELTETLTLAGFEVEDIEYRPSIQDIIIEISITSNRADTSSMIGLAREISTLFNTPLKNMLCDNQYNSHNIPKNNICCTSQVLLDLKISIIQLQEHNCSPIWLKNYLTGSGRVSTNILCDIYEYIKIKWGQDIEILNLYNSKTNIVNKDLDHNFRIHLEKIDITQVSRILKQLLGFNFIQNNHSHLPYIETIQYDNHIMSILGITSNKNFFCNKNSNFIMVIGQICKSEYIEDLMSKINKKTEKINTHLRGISRHDFKQAYQETIDLILNLNNGHIISDKYSYHSEYDENQTLYIKQDTINKILGPCKDIYNRSLPNQIINNIFEQLNFKPLQKDNIFALTIPEYRKKDIKRSIDIIEEVARIYGFNKFIDRIANYKQLGKISKTHKLINKVRHILRYLGLHEVIHYSLDNISLDYSLEQDEIHIYNPLLEDQSKLKTRLIQQLIDKSIYNANQKNSPLECFEIGKTFKMETHQSQNINYNEEIYLAGILGNYSFSRKLWSEKNQELTWFQCKGLLEELFEKLHAKIDWINIQNDVNYNEHAYYHDIYHPYRTAFLCNSKTGKTIGIFGQINTRSQRFSHIQYKQYIFEINIAHLMTTIQNNYAKHLYYNADLYSIYPSVIRDVSLRISNKTSVEKVKKYIINQNNALIESVEIFNEYKKQTNSINDRYVGFRITYRSSKRTLNYQDIEKIDNDIKHLLDINL